MIKSASLFSQLLQHFPRTEFAEIVSKHKAERHAKGFSCWSQFVAMLFCHLAAADSLRVICNGLSCCLGKLIHIGIKEAPKKSTLSYANCHRSSEMYRELFFTALDRFRTKGMLGSRKKFKFKNPLYSIDATVISLCLNMFPWAEFRRNKGGVKLHIALDHGDYMPVFVNIAEARIHEVNMAHRMRFNPGSIVVCDRGYLDYELFHKWTLEGIYFVSRHKSNTKYKVVKKHKIPDRRNIIADEVIQFTGYMAQKKCPCLLRRVVVWDEVNQKELELITNHMSFGATTIADIYRERWQIELFFKALKQNLKIKTFVGTSENALQIQIWTALTALLLIKWLKHLSQAGWSLTVMSELLRMNLFTYRDLTDWLRNPFETPPACPEQQQMVLSWI